MNDSRCASNDHDQCSTTSAAGSALPSHQGRRTATQKVDGHAGLRTSHGHRRSLPPAGTTGRWRHQPVRQQRALQFNALASIDHQLPVQWQMVGKLGFQQMCQPARPGDAACNRSFWRGCIHDGVAALACQLRTHKTDHGEAAWYPSELLCNVLTEGAQATASGGASFSWRRLHFLVLRQLIWQGTAHRFLPRSLCTAHASHAPLHVNGALSWPPTPRSVCIVSCHIGEFVDLSR